MGSEARKYCIIDPQHRIENIILLQSEEISLPEGYSIRLWQQGDVRYTDEQPAALPELVASQFHYMLAWAGLNNVINGVLNYLESNNHPMFPVVYGHLAGQVFTITKTLEIVSQLRPVVSQLYPDADVSDERINEAWQAALNWQA